MYQWAYVLSLFRDEPLDTLSDAIRVRYLYKCSNVTDPATCPPCVDMNTLIDFLKVEKVFALAKEQLTASASLQENTYKTSNHTRCTS